MRKWLLFILLLLPVAALASSNSGGLFSVASTDKSMEYLGMALGNIPGTPIQNGDNSLIGSLFYVFNQVVFVLGILIIVYTTIVGTIHTAQEGEFLGKNWHPILVPLRAAIGIYLLLPTTTGYNAVQITVMWFIVQGVGAANTLWKQVIVYNQNQGNIHADTRQVNLLGAGGTVTAIFDANVCMLTLNQNPDVVTALGTTVSVYQLGNQVQWGRLNLADTENPICGGITIPTVSSSSTNTAAQTSALASAIMAAQATLMGAANEAVNGGGVNTLGSSAFTTAANLLTSTAQNLQTSFDDLDSINQDAITNGWIHAGSYYFQLVQGGAGPSVSINYSASGMDAQTLTTLLGQTLAAQVMTTMNTNSSNYSNSTNNAISAPTESGALKLSKTGTNPQVASLLAIIFGGLMDTAVNSINQQITTGGANGDPILSMASFGATLTTAVEITFWASLALIFISLALTAILSCANPAGHTMNFLLAMILPVAIFMMSMLYAAGIVLALYIPLIPYLVFTFCAIGWIILVIEALLGSSLIALSLVIPSEDELGKAGHAFVILLGLFLRPALMILGFILAIQLLSVAVKMLNFGFWATLVASTGASSGLGIFGMVAVFLMYTSVATTLTHECFSLIYVLPNKVLRWMGGSPEGDEDPMHKVKESKGQVEKGGAMSKSAMGAIVSKAAPDKKK